MKKNISNFLKKAEDDPQLAARLDIARQHYIREVMLLAEEAGVLLTMEDFLDEAVSPVSYTHLDVYKRQVRECPGLLVNGNHESV